MNTFWDVALACGAGVVFVWVVLLGCILAPILDKRTEEEEQK